MRYLEYKHQGTWWGRAYDWIGNVLTLPTWAIFPILAVQYGYGSKPGWEWRNLLNLKAYTGREANGALYQNGMVFVRVMFPFWIGLSVRWSEHDLFQTGIGWKIIGRPAVHFRKQTDASAQGGLAIGFMDGPK